MVTDPPAVRDEDRQHLRRAMALQTAGEIDAALAEAERAVAGSPAFGEAHAYLGNTLVTRKRRFADGLAALDRAVALLPRDPWVRYTSGWCREFVANELARPKRPHQAVAQSADDLYAAARAEFLAALALDPDDQLRGDVEDMLNVVAAATGEPWDDSLVERAKPRER
jgi:tetratricopeptide (TPR) repeat protein